ncbi:MAG: hypothetical protein ACKOXM_00555 [Agromyces sp.]
MNKFRAALCAIMSLVPSIALPVMTAHSASAQPMTDEVFENGYIKIVSYANPAMWSLQPGNPVDWQLSIEPLAGGSGTMNVGFALANSPAESAGLSIEIRACSVKWVSGNCAGSSSLLVPSTPVSTAFTNLNLEGVAQRIASIPIQATPTATWLNVRVTPEASLAGSATATFLIAVAGLGQPLIVRPESGQYGLAQTGFTVTGWIVLGCTLLISGLIMFVQQNRRRDSRTRRPISIARGDVRK